VNHSDIKSLTANYLDGELPLETRARFDGHLDQCDDCSQELADMRATIKLLRTLPNPEPPSDLVDNVMARIREGEAQPAWHERLGDFFSQLAIPRFALPATAMAAGLAVVMLAGEVQLPATGRPIAPDSQIAMTPMTPTPASVARETRSDARSSSIRLENMRLENMRLADVRRGAPQTGGSFVYRSNEQDLGPMNRQPRAGGFPFQDRSQRVGPVFGATAVGEPPVHLVTVRAADGARGAQSPGLREYVRSHPDMVGDLKGSLPSAESQELSRDDHRRQELDRRLSYLIQNPTRFAQQLSAQSLATQELWLQQLASRAVDHEQSERVAGALRNSGVVTADFLADTFASAAERSIDQRAANIASQHEAE
jgi:hypothetical protein